MDFACRPHTPDSPALFVPSRTRGQCSGVRLLPDRSDLDIALFRPDLALSVSSCHVHWSQVVSMAIPSALIFAPRSSPTFQYAPLMRLASSVVWRPRRSRDPCPPLDSPEEENVRSSVPSAPARQPPQPAAQQATPNTCPEPDETRLPLNALSGERAQRVSPVLGVFVPQVCTLAQGPPQPAAQRSTQDTPLGVNGLHVCPLAQGSASESPPLISSCRSGSGVP